MVRGLALVASVLCGSVVALVSPSAGASAPVVAAIAPSLMSAAPPGQAYNPVTPTRVCDTRPAGPSVAANQCNHNGTAPGTMVGGSTMSVAIGGLASVPPSPTAAVLNVTVTGTSAASYLTVWPAGQPKPNASSVNWAAGQTVPNLVEVTLGSAGGPVGVEVFNAAGSADVVIDVEGYVDAAASSTYFPILPNRLCDTRPPSAWVAANPCNTPAASKLGPGSTRQVKIGGQWRVPSTGVTAAVLNFTVTNTTSASYLTAWPNGPRPTASNLNWAAGETLANRVIVPVAADGTILVFNQAGLTDVIVDVVAYFSTTPGGSRYVALNPTRVCDTRAAVTSIPANQCNNQGTGTGTLSTGEFRHVLVQSAVGASTAQVEDVVVNITVTNTSSSSYLTAWSGIPKPPTSDIDWSAGATRANLAIVGIGTRSDSAGSTRDTIDLFNATGSADVVIDVAGYYAAPYTLYAGLAPRGIVTGPDGALWFTNQNDWIGRITTNGVITRYSGFGILEPRDIVVGGDDALWFTEGCCNTIGRLTTDGSIATFIVPGGAGALALGPDGAIWVTSGGRTISRITQSGVVTTYSGIGTGGYSNITTGSDGALWFTSSSANAIGRITTAGAVTTFTGLGITSPNSIVAGPDGALWFTNGAPGSVSPVSIARITTAGAVTAFTSPSLSQPSGLTVGPDGALWFVNGPFGGAGRITTSGEIAIYTGWVNAITAGPDGALWFTDSQHSSIDRMTTTGTVTDTFTQPGVTEPFRIVHGPDDAMWFTNLFRNSIGRIGSDGTITQYTIPVNYAEGITLGPDGALWFTAGTSIGRITTGGAITMNPAPIVARELTAGPDGALWFTGDSNAIGRMTTSGVSTTYTDASISGPRGITAGPDGALWFVNATGNSISRITTAGVVTTYTSASVSEPNDIAPGPDGALWFTNHTGNTIGRITTSGLITSYAGLGIWGPQQITVGSDSALWFTNTYASITRITTSGAITSYAVPPTGQFGDIAAGASDTIWFSMINPATVGHLSL